MKVLFVSSGNNKFGVSPVVKTQGESLERAGVALEYFTIQGKGSLGYLHNVRTLREFLARNQYDLIHSHFFLSSVVASVSNLQPLVVSLMGSDVYTSKYWNVLIRLFRKARWGATIVKTEKMKAALRIEDVHVIPNGVDLSTFCASDKRVARNRLGLDPVKKYVLFASDPARTEKNFKLAKESVRRLNDSNVELLVVHGLERNLMPLYLNSIDALLLTSAHEGSPNIVKEAVACARPIVSTDVGDVGWLLRDIQGCFLTSFDPSDVADKIKKALNFSKRVGRTHGRDRIVELGLDSETIAGRILAVYSEVLNRPKGTRAEANGPVADYHVEGRSW